MKYEKIVTHNGKFHADEILVIALLFNFDYELPFERTRDKNKLEHYLRDPSVIVIDVGKNYDTEMNNFDHHQDSNLPAPNRLILHHYIKDEGVTRKLREKLFDFVSDLDKGAVSDGGPDHSFNAIIRNFNGMDRGFYYALHIAINILKGYIHQAHQALEGEKEWQKLAKKDGILVLVQPDVDGGYQITSRSINDLVIPKDNKNQDFRYDSGFMAVYPNPDTAIHMAQHIINRYSI